MTSLATQLAGLAAQRAARTDVASAVRQRDSYLFTPRVAAEQDYATVHALGVTGWEQLVNEDAGLAAFPYADLLFGDESVRMDRATLPASENARLDEACTALLYVLGPVLLSRSAAKCLEWLVRRFAVHVHVPRVVVHVFLPYHTTPQFARMLQLVPVDREPALHFLAAVKRAQTPLPTSLLVQAMGAHDDVLRLVAQTQAPAGVPARRVPVTFWTATLVQFCLQLGAPASRKRAVPAQRAHEVLAIVLPEALRLLAPPVDTEAAVGALMVLCSLSTALALSPAAVRGVLESVARVGERAEVPPVLARALVACCFALCASPDAPRDAFADAPLITAPALRALLALPELGAQVTRALREHDVRRFAAELLAALAAHLAWPEARALLDTLLAAPLPDALVQAACEALVRAPDAGRPAALDAALDAVRRTDEARAWAALSAVLHYGATGAVPAADADAPPAALWLGVHAGDAAQRALALTELFRAVERGAVRADDALVADAVRAALAAPSAALLQAVYDGGAQVAVQALAPDALLAAIAARVAEDVAPKEYKLHVRFAVQRLARAAPELAPRVWEAVVWPGLLSAPHAQHAVAALDGAPGVLGAYGARLRGAPGERAACARHVVEAVVAEVGAQADPGAALAFLLRAADAPVSRGGALALLVLGQLLARGAVRDDAFFAAAHGVAARLAAHQLLAGDGPDVVPSEDVDAALAPVLAAVSRGAVRELGVHLLYLLARHAPVPGDASLFVAVQQQSTPAARLVWHVWRTLHAPGVGHVVRARVTPALYARLGADTLALLAGVWAMERAVPHGAPSDEAERVRSLRHAAHLVRRAAAADTALDVQTLLPSVLLVLQDASAAVRDAGAQLVAALAAAPAPTGAAEIYGYERVYGAASAALQYLDAPTLARYVARLAEDAPTFVNDAGSLAATHAAALAGTKKDAAAFRSRVLCYVLSHAVCWPSTAAATGLLHAVHRVDAPCKLPTVAPLVARAVAAPDAVPAAYLALLFATYDARALTDATWDALLAALRGPAALQDAAVHVLQAGLLAALPRERRAAALLALARAVADPRVATTPAAAAALRTLPVADEVLVDVLRTLLAALQPDEDDARAKRARTADDGVQAAAVVLIAVLEGMQSRTLGVRAPLVAALFDVVRAAVSLHASVLFNAEYVLQLAMQTLCALFDHVTALPADVAQVVRADTIVHAIKISTNTQSINHAILLLTRFARLDAELVLHNVMPIFTFVGHAVLQRDDRFTLAVVDQTLRSIVPAFVNAVRPQVVNAQDTRLALWLETRALLRIFSEAASHIPRHRRLVFFRRLVEVLGADDFLAPVAMLLTDRVAHRVDRTPGSAASLLQLPLGVLRAEPDAARIAALDQILPEVQRLYAGDTAFLATTPKRAYSDEHAAPAKQAHALLCLVRHALPTHAPPDAAPLARVAWRAVCTWPPDAAGADAARHVRAAAVRPLPDAALAPLVRALLRGERAAVPGAGSVPAHVPRAELQREALAWLAVRDIADGVDDVHDALLHVWSQHRGTPLGTDALAALQRSVDAAHASSDTARLAALLPPLLAAPDSDTPAVLALLARLVAHTGVKALAHLNALATTACDAAVAEDAAHVAAGLVLLAALFRALPQFLHAYVERAVRVLCNAHVLALQRARAPGVRAAHRVLQDAVVKRMPFATLLDALTRGWRHVDAVPLLHLLHLGVRGLDRAAVGAHYKPLFRFLLQAMALQQDAGAGASLQPAPARAIEVYLALALKLSESQFRPLFLRTYDWAAVDLLDTDDGAPDAGATYARALVLYALVTQLLDRLRGMVTSYVAVVYDHARQLLAHDTPPTPLWYAVVQALTRSAEVDEGSFWNTARATQLVAPLLTPLPSLAADDRAAVEAMAHALLAVAETVPDDTYLHALNTQLLTYASSSTLRVRIHALDLAAQVWDAHGANLLGFVPETVAQLAELLDDADPRAAAAALRLRRAIEAALGEPLDSYLA
ncbi:snoRNA-binding rRNA-processing protein utp10 [Malassezia brasiliensis]|uniref:U3 small nucleolar RNA-associated protein 10 n=1 Tax=Malassezia brasiliensis TaxID=1821822 RepID=A0AAF0DTL4_9BASI|nr:snoRNA-binding rRNA-processing protein utp10 [Malassezia brasiliensis]